MRIILDANIIISALIKDSMTRKILFNSGWLFYYPQEALVELRRYRQLIITKSNLSEKEYIKLFSKLFKMIILIPNKAILPNFKEASSIMANIDPDDILFIACALNKSAIIWSDDKHFQKQKVIHVLNSKQVIRIFSRRE